MRVMDVVASIYSAEMSLQRERKKGKNVLHFALLQYERKCSRLSDDRDFAILEIILSSRPPSLRCSYFVIKAG